MAEGHARVAGKFTREATIGGKKYTLHPLLVGMYAQLENYILSFRDDPLVVAARACQLADPADRSEIWKHAIKAAQMARVVSTEESAIFERSPRGQAFKLWCMIKGQHLIPTDNHVDPKTKQVIDHTAEGVEACLRLMEEAGEEEMEMLMAQMQAVSGEDELKNSSGPVPPTGPQEEDGLSSTNDSPTSSIGPHLL